ncbi:hypothetical protein KUCAC02_001182 [Chaenocephalus aceratus]|uniref:Uncharacterized protein n=1 Tax=Chaenocephalus aceratus TaxID=36190 RepID=A0ACB9XVK8_CHAAC|nr:hypothetical protein KUCAC02_001182 [Chaenocephalus aceratus]
MAGQRKCTCHRPGRADSWLFSRFSTGWSCGLHADWTELTSCVPTVMNKRDKKSVQKNKRNFYYITMLRDPVSRYLSEWKHVQRGATWKTALHMCDGRSPTEDELPACYSGDDWTGVPLIDFMSCPSKPRQQPAGAHAGRPQPGGLLQHVVGERAGARPGAARQRQSQPAQHGFLRPDGVPAQDAVPVRADVSACASSGPSRRSTARGPPAWASARRCGGASRG